MMFDLDEDIYDENKIEEVELNCQWTITVPSGASHDFMITKLRWSEHPYWLTASIYPIDSPAKPIILCIKRETLAFAKLFVTLTPYKRYHPEPHLTQHDIHTLRELMDSAEFHMETHTGYYIQEIKKIIKNQSN